MSPLDARVLAAVVTGAGGWLLVVGVLALLLVLLLPRVAAWFIERRLGGYVHLVNRPSQLLPLRLQREVSVAVIGAGVAGLTAARTLAARGYRVTLFESSPYIGGKLGSWPVELEAGRTVQVSHGFHAFFPHYYNLNRLLDALGARGQLQSIGDYVIISREGKIQRFAGLPKTPVLNLLGMLRKGAFSLRDALRAPGRDCYGVFLEYDQEVTFRDLDGLSYEDFARRTRLPRTLELSFGTFARAFFASRERMSMAELIKAFHFYYLSHDGGLVYDFPVDDYEPWLLAPLRRELASLGAELRTNHRVQQLERLAGSFVVDGRPFDRVVLATDAPSTAQVMSRSKGFPEQTAAALSRLTGGQRYAVWRIWVDRDVRADLPVFVITEQLRALDSVTMLHRFERSTQEDVARHGGYVLELHSYSVPDELEDAQVRDALLEDLIQYFPELSGLRVAHESFQLRRDFTAFHTGMFRSRPSTDVGTPGFYCAGDWVKLPFPAMLLEAACASGLYAACAVLRLDGLREEAVYSVPPRGLLAGMPAPPGRAKVLGLW